MTRTKVKLEFVMNNASRKACFNKRKKGLMKKVEELSTLCGVEMCAIIYGPLTREPELWPPSPNAVQSVLSRFKGLPEFEKTKRMENHEGFNEKRIRKSREQIKNQQKDNRGMEVNSFMYQCLAGKRLQNFSFVDLKDLDLEISHRLKEVSRRIACGEKHIPRQPPLQMPLETSNRGGDKGSIVAPEVAQVQNLLGSMNVPRANSATLPWWLN